MEGYDAPTYGDRIADVYDEWYAELDPAPAVEFLAGLAGEGRALELAIGTGRIALPLAERGVEVHGIDASERMVEKLRAKPGGDRIPVSIGDFADVGVEGTFRVVFVAFNTFFALEDQEEQVRCFANVASHLDEDGVFVIEAFVPDLTRFDRGQRVSSPRMGLDHVLLDVSQHDPVAQVSFSQHVLIEDGRTSIYPVRVRYAWPSELDLMARLAGLRLRARHADWSGTPFTADAGSHVSVYERVAATAERASTS
ncbi:MAG: class I SAM-dependent DNA methyltransferase [Pseudomonadota bacterium]